MRLFSLWGRSYFYSLRKCFRQEKVWNGTNIREFLSLIGGESDSLIICIYDTMIPLNLCVSATLSHQATQSYN